MTTKIETDHSDQVEITELQGKLILAIEAKDTDAQDTLTQEIAEVRSREAKRKEIADMAVEVEKRDELRKRKERILERIRLQGEAIDAFMAKVQEITIPLQELVIRAKELPKLQLKTWEFYYNAQQLSFQNKIPAGLLPPGTTAPTLGLRGGLTDPQYVGGDALRALNHAFTLLTGLEVINGIIPTREPAGFEVFSDGHDPDIPGAEIAEEVSEVESPKESAGDCFVCRHPMCESVNKFLEEGHNLRDIEEYSGISRSSISRHKNNCLR